MDRLTLSLFLASILVSAQIRFRDVAPNVATTYRTHNGETLRKYFPQPMCGGVVLLDFDGDGLLDIFLTNGADLPSNRKIPAIHSHALLRNLGNGRFQDRTAASGLSGLSLGYSLGAAAADFDNDGDADLFVANLGANTLYRNDGAGRFKDITSSSGLLAKLAQTISVGAAWFDYDQDGLLDLFVPQYTTWTPASDILCRQADGTPIYSDPRRYPSVPGLLYRNVGQGRFEDRTAASGIGRFKGKAMGVSVADFNLDGTPDLFVAAVPQPE